ncbi:hypothetical protein L596_000128 [Steinernema carpocapsae]|uniref:Uncharacterized protein n=1 Tax=Steinernema carpocapsae TaxID=34508 RepID=A0A4U8UH40_STECR|nr:hypothetical protein L596_000128 [Steinernema carpocapsae]
MSLFAVDTLFCIQNHRLTCSALRALLPVALLLVPVPLVARIADALHAMVHDATVRVLGALVVLAMDFVAEADVHDLTTVRKPTEALGMNVALGVQAAARRLLHALRRVRSGVQNVALIAETSFEARLSTAFWDFGVGTGGLTGGHAGRVGGEGVQLTAADLALSFRTPFRQGNV